MEHNLLFNSLFSFFSCVGELRWSRVSRNLFLWLPLFLFLITSLFLAFPQSASSAEEMEAAETTSGKRNISYSHLNLFCVCC